MQTGCCKRHHQALDPAWCVLLLCNIGRAALGCLSRVDQCELPDLLFGVNLQYLLLQAAAGHCASYCCFTQTVGCVLTSSPLWRAPVSRQQLLCCHATAGGVSSKSAAQLWAIGAICWLAAATTNTGSARALACCMLFSCFLVYTNSGCCPSPPTRTLSSC